MTMAKQSYIRPDGTPYEPSEHPCSICLREEWDDGSLNTAAVGTRATGVIWNVDDGRYRVFNGYLCDGHAENVERIRWRS